MPVNPALFDSATAFWKLEEASGNRTDEIGSHVLTDVNTVGTASGVIDQAATFVSAASEHFTFSTPTPVNPSATQSFSMAFWARISTASGSRAVLNLQDAANVDRCYQTLFSKTNNQLLFGVSSDGAAMTNVLSAAISTFNSFYLWVCGWDQANGEIFLWTGRQGADNLSSKLTTAFAGPIHQSSEPFRVATKGGTGSFWDSRIDEIVFLKDLVFTQDDAEWIYNEGNARTQVEWAALTVPLGSAALKNWTSFSTNAGN